MGGHILKKKDLSHAPELRALLNPFGFEPMKDARLDLYIMSPKAAARDHIYSHLHDDQDLFPGLVEDVVCCHICPQDLFPALSRNVYLAMGTEKEVPKCQKKIKRDNFPNAAPYDETGWRIRTLKLPQNAINAKLFKIPLGVSEVHLIRRPFNDVLLDDAHSDSLKSKQKRTSK